MKEFVNFLCKGLSDLPCIVFLFVILMCLEVIAHDYHKLNLVCVSA